MKSYAVNTFSSIAHGIRKRRYPEENRNRLVTGLLRAAVDLAAAGVSSVKLRRRYVSGRNCPAGIAPIYESYYKLRQRSQRACAYKIRTRRVPQILGRLWGSGGNRLTPCPSGSIGALLTAVRIACFASLLRLASSASGGASASEPFWFSFGTKENIPLSQASY